MSSIVRLRRLAAPALTFAVLCAGVSWWFLGNGGIDSRATQLSCGLAVVSLALSILAFWDGDTGSLPANENVGKVGGSSVMGERMQRIVLGDDNRWRGAIRVEGSNYGSITQSANAGESGSEPSRED